MIHILDLIMWFATCGFIWFLLDVLFKGELTEELGGIIGIGILFVYTLIYIIIFVWPVDLNWVDIFHGDYSIPKWIKW